MEKLNQPQYTFELTISSNVWMNSDGFLVLAYSPVRSIILVFFLYAILLPFLCACGLFQNIICLWVLNKEQFKCSFYVYLRVIATVDVVMCMFAFLSGFGRGTFWWSGRYLVYNAFVSFPVSIFLVNMGTIATVFITLDRLYYLRNPLRRVKPKFCRRRTARIITCFGLIFSIFYTLPYCFIFNLGPDNKIESTPFFNSWLFELYSWFDFCVAAVLPATILIIGNTLLIKSIRNTVKLQKKSKMITGKTRRLRDQTKLTTTLIAIVFFYIFFELPIHFSKPKIAQLVLFGDGEISPSLRGKIELVTIMLMMTHVNIKFVLYCLFCPPFSRAVMKTVCKNRRRQRQKESKLFCITECGNVVVPYQDKPSYNTDSKVEEESSG